MKHGDDVCARVAQLRDEHSYRQRAKHLIREVMAGGDRGLAAIIGKGPVNALTVPAANLVLSGLQRLGQKVGRMPDLRVDPPDDRDSETARKHAEKRARIVAAWDDASALEQDMPYQGMWLPGYGFCVWTLREGRTPDGDPYPEAERRDPYSAYPGEFGMSSQPADLAVVWKMPARQLADRYRDTRPDVVAALYDRRAGGVLLDPHSTPAAGTSTWTDGAGGASSSGSGVEVAEYYDSDGCWLVIPDKRIVLEHWPNPLRSGPPFVVIRRPTFGQLVGHYDDAFGLQQGMARMNTLALIALEDAVHTETNVYGQINGQYRKGRHAINTFDPGTRVEKPVTQIPYQVFQEVSRLEEQFRQVVGYSRMDDGQTPANMAATGHGLDKLAAGIDLEVRQYHKQFEWGLQLLDQKRLEWAHRSYGQRDLPIVGMVKGAPFAERYRPDVHIKGNYRTRRTFGAMAGLDDAQKIVALLQLLQAGLIDSQTAREQLDGLENLTRIEDRIRAEQVESTLFGAMVSGQPMDPRVAMTLIELLPASSVKETLRRFWTPDDPQMSPEQEAMVAPPPAPPVPTGPGGGPPDVATVLSRLTSSGDVAGGVQTVGRLPARVA